ncbi:TonB-dependent receptor plug domain-containing protein [Flavobacterium sp. GA093]|uniref:TonB-dependent receptor plug domain-containing protein n=1 Tax=Flavobacterium hydrocarbonoxydans TaxID=2683249 RepID=A0A6I4NM39_9FLAO|nr:carboxypeptidase-like regulatory domain-containing protein [Flavobacterium hydrocarbonoxydans]MWB93635.1 TonB-dependent receptor plug domain-containing protein [Flavobacterium hydrocarbonoxydans]
MKVYLLILSLFFCGISFAQNTITGSVTDSKNESIPGANIIVVGDQSGASADFDGSFTLKTDVKPPFTIKVSAVGYQSKTINVTSASQKISVVLSDEENKLDEIVVSASRTPERVIESPVTIERMGIQEIRNTTAPTFYDGLENLKEVHFNTSSISFKSINTRGFASVANTRFMQLVDGMDNSSPALNFVLGNLIGVSDIDVANVELLPGASSALYGANAFNGILFMNSKSPFTNEGISTYFKYGQTNQDAAGTNDYVDFGLRAAKAFTKHFAMKANFTFTRATEWIAADQRSMTGGSVGHANNQNYDGLNLYGDEVTTFISNVGQVSRTGYREQDLTDNKVKNIKGDFSFHFKPWANDTEIIAQYKVGLGSTIYQGANRYALKDFIMQQGKIEVKGKNFFARVYATTEDAGNSYDMRFAAWNVNRAAKSDTEWFTNYATAYQLSGAVMGTNATESAAIARNYADYNKLPAALVPLPQFATAPTGKPRFEPGSAQFNQALAKVVANPDLTQGAKFIDQSKLYHSDVNYNFKDMVDFAEIQVGGSWRKYIMNSDGTIFTDYDGPIDYKEYGAYTQLTKKLLDDRLKFTGSVRYDKSQNFDGNLSPRLSLVYSAGESKRHNFRVSYQTGFRNPTTQDQYIGLDLGPFALIGSAEENLDRFQETQPVSPAGQALPGNGATVNLSGRNAYENAYTVASVQAFGASGNTADLQVANIGLVKPEEVQAFEVGYRSVVQNDLSIDINAYYNIYNDFMNTARVISPYYGTAGTDSTDPAVQLSYAALALGDRRVYQVYTNTTAEISSLGFGVGLSKKVYKDFELGVNYNYAQFDFDQSEDPSFIAGFNTPKHRIKGSIGNSNVTKNLGFNLNVRWNTEYLWQSSFGDGMIPENTVLDAQVNYAFPKLKSVLKVGATNLFGKDYLQVIGAGAIGQQWFASWTINP